MTIPSAARPTTLVPLDDDEEEEEEEEEPPRVSRRDASPLPPLDNDPFTEDDDDPDPSTLISITSESAASCAPASRDPCRRVSAPSYVRTSGASSSSSMVTRTSPYVLARVDDDVDDDVDEDEDEPSPSSTRFPRTAVSSSSSPGPYTYATASGSSSTASSLPKTTLPVGFSKNRPNMLPRLVVLCVECLVPLLVVFVPRDPRDPPPSPARMRAMTFHGFASSAAMA